MATHGRTGISRWVIGSVADRVLRSSRIATLMVTPPGYRAET
ncbi:MAG: universal stress protein [Chloroflexota bacterium]